MCRGHDPRLCGAQLRVIRAFRKFPPRVAACTELGLVQGTVGYDKDVSPPASPSVYFYGRKNLNIEPQGSEESNRAS